MSRSFWIPRLCQPLKNRRRKQQSTSPRGKRCRPRLEALEDRTLLSGGLPYPTPSNVSQLTADIAYANNNAGSYTITLAASTTFDFTSANNSTNGANALPVVTGNITIAGNGDTLARSSSAPAFRLFDVASGGSVTLENVTLTGGLAQGTGAAAEGGAIYSSGTLALSGVTVKSNTARGSNGAAGTGKSVPGGAGANAFGGGLYAAAGSVSLSNDTFSSNKAQGGKGGSGHASGRGGAGGNASGGGLYVSSQGSVTLTNDTFSDNGALGGTGGGAGGYYFPSRSAGAGGNASGGGFYVASPDSVTLSGFTLSGNKAQGGKGGSGYTFFPGGAGGNGSGGGLYVASTGSVSLTNDTLSDNDALGGSGGGGGIDIFRSGGAGGDGSGGGIYVSQGTVTLSKDSLSGNKAQGGNGGGGSVGSTSGNGGTGGNGSGGGLDVANAGSVTLSNDTLNGNDALGGNGGVGGHGERPGGSGGGGNAYGGGMYASTPGNVALSNDTLSGNDALGGSGGGGTYGMDYGASGGAGGIASGGGMYVSQGSLTLTNDTVSDNSAQGGNGGGGGFGQQDGGGGGAGGNGSGGGLFIYSGSTTTLTNTLIAENNVLGGSGGGGAYGMDYGAPGAAGSVSGPDVSGNVASSDHDLIGDGTGSNLSNGSNGDLVGTSANPINPLLAPLGNYGGPTQTMALLPGSPAIDAGSSAYGGSTDQRGESRVGATDIGAFESQGFTLTISSGNNQSAVVNTAFANPLVVTVTANNPVEPVAGGAVTFTVPASGASAVLSGSPATIGSNGQASVTATANAIGGAYAVSASASGVASPAPFSLSNEASPKVSIMPIASVTAGSPVTAQGSFSESTGSSYTPYSYRWTATNSSGAVVQSQSGQINSYPASGPAAVPNFTFTPAGAGTYTVHLIVTDKNNLSGSANVVLTVISPVPPPAPPPPPLSFPQSVLTQIVTDMQILPSFQTTDAQDLLGRLFGLAFSMASAQSPQQAIDLFWSELGLTWDLLLTGGNVQVLTEEPQAISLANAIDQDPLYHTLTGWLMANAEMELLLVG